MLLSTELAQQELYISQYAHLLEMLTGKNKGSLFEVLPLHISLESLGSFNSIHGPKNW